MSIRQYIIQMQNKITKLSNASNPKSLKSTHAEPKQTQSFFNDHAIAESEASISEVEAGSRAGRNSIIFGRTGQALRNSARRIKIASELGCQDWGAKAADQVGEHQVLRLMHSKMYHPTIYHHPQTRKNFFHAVVDSYMCKGKKKQLHQADIPGRPKFIKTVINSSEKNISGKKLYTQQDLQKDNATKRRANTAGLTRNPDEQRALACKPASRTEKVFQFAQTCHKVSEQSLRKHRTEHITSLGFVGTRHEIESISSDGKDQSPGKQQQQSLVTAPRRDRHLELKSKVKAKMTTCYQNRRGRYSSPSSNAMLSGYSFDSPAKNSLLQTSDLTKQLYERLRSLGTEWVITGVYENRFYRLFMVAGINLKQQPQKIKIKEIKSSTQGEQIHSALHKMAMLGPRQMWCPLPKMSAKNYNSPLLWCESWLTLRQHLFKITRQQRDPSVELLRIAPTSHHSLLFANNCEQLRMVLLCIVRAMRAIRGRALCNKLTLDNLYLLGERDVRVGDWDTAATCSKIVVQGRDVLVKSEPVLRADDADIAPGEKGTWLVEPECLAPQIINNLIAGSYSRIWQQQESPQPEVWSLGVIMLQILTAVPVWMPLPTAHLHLPPRVGYFHDPLKRLPVIHEKQRKVEQIVSRWGRDNQGTQFHSRIHPQLLRIMKQALQVNPRNRPRLQQIEQRLNSI